MSGVARILAFLILAAAATEPATQPSTHTDMKRTSPNPQLTPEQVVRIQLEALQHNDQPTADAGIALAFKFASPENQAQTGPLGRFIEMVKSPEYGLMLNHQSAELGEIHIDASSGQAKQLVRLTAADGDAALFIFVLSKQTDGQYKDCWMTDSVVRLRPQDLAPVAPPEPGTNGDGHDKT